MLSGTAATHKKTLAAAIATLAIAAGTWWWSDFRPARFLPEGTAEFVAAFTPPPAAGSPAERRELDELLVIQEARTDAQVSAARADRKTEVTRFFAALGVAENGKDALPKVRRLAQHVEDDVRRYVRAAKQHFRRLRPFEVEPRLDPCIDDVQTDLSYPSGHATYGYVMALLLADMVPERRGALLTRGDEFAHQRMVCGVHFSSDLVAGRAGAEWLIGKLRENAQYQREHADAAQELRAALGLRPLQREPRAAEVGAGAGRRATPMQHGHTRHDRESEAEAARFAIAAGGFDGTHLYVAPQQVGLAPDDTRIRILRTNPLTASIRVAVTLPTAKVTTGIPSSPPSAHSRSWIRTTSTASVTTNRRTACTPRSTRCICPSPGILRQTA